MQVLSLVFFVLYTILIKFVITVLKTTIHKVFNKVFHCKHYLLPRRVKNRRVTFSYAVMILLSTVIFRLHGNFADNSSSSSSELQAICLFCDL